MIHYRHGVTIVRNSHSRVLWYVQVTCGIRNCMLEQLHGVYCLLLLFCPVERFIEFASASATSCAFRATDSPLQAIT